MEIKLVTCKNRKIIYIYIYTERERESVCVCVRVWDEDYDRKKKREYVISDNHRVVLDVVLANYWFKKVRHNAVSAIT
jgi:hypothetical protein